jgi:alkylation response protein AidB-like acyl-CoA dehydrogenase
MAHQVHGAIGFTEEFVLQRYTKCLWTWREDAGSESAWYDLLGSAALRGGSAGLWPAFVEGAPL